MAHIRQSRPDSGLGFHVKARTTFQLVPSSLGSGRECIRGILEREGGRERESAREKEGWREGGREGWRDGERKREGERERERERGDTGFRLGVGGVGLRVEG